MSDLTVRRVTQRRRLLELGRSMDNCLATYGRNRLDGPDRIYEVLRDGETVYAVHIRAGKIVMFEAPNNRPPRRGDVPIVRRLLTNCGALDATRAEAAEQQRRDDELAVAARRRRPRPTPRARTRRAPARQEPPAPRPARPTWMSVQQLAADLLEPHRDRPEWTDVAAGLWALGVLPQLVDPAEHVWEPVIVDLAGDVATGTLTLDPSRTVDLDVRREAAAELLAAADQQTREGFQRLAMADLLVADLRP